MRHIYYTIQTLLRSRSGNVVKLLSLTLGLLVGVLLFSQIAYELNYDTCYKEHERLAMFGIRFVSKDGSVSKQWEYDTFRPAASAIMEEFPEEVECATPVFAWYSPKLYMGDNPLENVQTIFGDTLFFQTMGIEVLQGNPKELANMGNAFLSESKARELFGTEEAIGKTINFDRMFDVTVRGIYKDVAGGVSFPHNIVLSLPSIEDGFGYGRGTWTSNDVYLVHIRLRSADDLETVSGQMTKLLDKYYGTDSYGRHLEGRIIPVADYHLTNPDHVQRLVLLGVLGFAIFFVAGMNYVLAAIATIGRRAKMVGVHKCSGATAGGIMAMFLLETGLMMLAAMACSLCLLFLFLDPIESMLGLTRISELFTLQMLWVPILTIVALFIVAGVLPGRMFAKIPVTQVFRRYTDDKRSWKVGLLFVQFLGVAFILGLLMTCVWQYHQIMTKDAGFDEKRLVVGLGMGIVAEVGGEWGKVFERFEFISDDLRRLPYVESVGCTENRMLSRYSTYNETAEGGKKRVLVHYQYYLKGFPEAVGLRLVEGTLPKQTGEALVSESFVEAMNWGDQVMGRSLLLPAGRGSNEPTRVVGVVKNIRNLGALAEETHTCFVLGPAMAFTFNVRLKEPAHENMLQLNDYIKQTFPKTGLKFLSYEDVRRENYAGVEYFRNVVYITSACVLLIVLLGLIGYVSDETQRRSKEIAIRKVNGAEASDILRLLSKGILKVAIGAVLIGIGASYYVSGLWMEQFADSSLLSPLWFVLLLLLILALIVTVVIFRAWQIANENPVKSIKSE